MSVWTRRALWLAVVSCVCLPAFAADLAKLEWGEFTVESDSSAKPKSWSASATDDGMTMSMLFDALQANADGGTNEASANISGYFAIRQPSYVPLRELRIELRGHIVKTAGTSGRLDVTVGTATKTLEWPEAAALSQPFTETINAPVDGGQLPNPFPIAVLAFARKNPGEGAILVSLDSIDVSAGTPKIASREP